MLAHRGQALYLVGQAQQIRQVVTSSWDLCKLDGIGIWGQEYVLHILHSLRPMHVFAICSIALPPGTRVLKHHAV